MRRPGTASTSCVVSPSLFNSVVCVLLTFVGRRRIFGAAKAEALVVRAAQEKRAVEHRGRDSAFIKRAVPPRATFECLVLLAVVFTGMGVAGIGLVPGRRPFPHVAGHVVKAKRTHAIRKRSHGHGIAPCLRMTQRCGVLALSGSNSLPHGNMRPSVPRAAFSHSSSVGSRLPAQAQ